MDQKVFRGEASGGRVDGLSRLGPREKRLAVLRNRLRG